MMHAPGSDVVLAMPMRRSPAERTVFAAMQARSGTRSGGRGEDQGAEDQEEEEEEDARIPAQLPSSAPRWEQGVVSWLR